MRLIFITEEITSSSMVILQNANFLHEWALAGKQLSQVLILLVPIITLFFLNIKDNEVICTMVFK